MCSKTDLSEEYIKEFIKETAEARNIQSDSIKGYEDMIINFGKSLDKNQTIEWCKKQTYIALGMLLEAAALKKIDASPMEGFDSKEVDEVLNLKEQGFTTAVLCALGYRSEEDKTQSYAKVRFQSSKIIEKR